MNNAKQYPKSFLLEFRRIFLLADLFMDCWDAGRGGLHSALGQAYVGKQKGVGGHSINGFWTKSISEGLSQNRSVHEIARLINKGFKCLVDAPEFDSLTKEYVCDIKDRPPVGKGTLEAQAFRGKLYEHYIRYLQDCIAYQEGEGFRDWSRLAEYLFHPNQVVGESTRSGETNAPKHKEHVVPLRCINNLVIEGLNNGSSPEDIRTFLDNALKIVIIHKEEQKKIDRHWKNCMPTDWKIGNSVFDRLEKAGVKFELDTPAP